MVIYSFRSSTYARNIYLYGTTTFDSIPAEYHEPTKQYAAANFTKGQIETAHNNLFISDAEYQQTLVF